MKIKMTEKGCKGLAVSILAYGLISAGTLFLAPLRFAMAVQFGLAMLTSLVVLLLVWSES